MLERIREGAQGPWAMAIIGLIVLSFVFAGVGSYLTSSAPTAVASVNGEDITANELERAYQNRRAQLEQQFGEGFSALFADPAYLATFKDQILEQMIGDLLLKQHAESLGMRVSDQQVRDAIVALPQFQLGGQFNNDRYLSAIRQAGFQPSDFREYIRREMTRDQLSKAIGASSFGLQNAAKRIASLEQQTRDAKTLTVNASLFSDTVTVSEEEIQVYYDANVAQFDTEERVDLAYVQVSVADLENDVIVTEQDIEQYYQDNIATYETEASRSVSHILVEFGDDRDAARARIEAIQSRLNGGESFETLAENESDDTFSAENGGDLGEITAGMMGDAFEEAAFALSNVGDVTDIVETDFGYHLIKANVIVESTTASLAEVKDDIESTLKRDQALDRYFQLQSLMAQLAFEVPDTLDDLASELNTEVKTTGLFSRTNAPEPFERADILSQAFSEELVAEQVNSEVIELDNENVLVMRVAAHEPQRTRTIDEVRADITARLNADKTQDAAQKWAQSLVDTLQSDATAAATMAEEKGLSWTEQAAVSRNSADLARAMSESLFTLGSDAPNNIEVVELGNGDIGVVELVAVNNSQDIAEDVVTQYQQRLAATHGRDVLASVIESLRTEGDVRIMQPVVE